MLIERSPLTTGIPTALSPGILTRNKSVEGVDRFSGIWFNLLRERLDACRLL